MPNHACKYRRACICENCTAPRAGDDVTARIRDLERENQKKDETIAALEREVAEARANIRARDAVMTDVVTPGYEEMQERVEQAEARVRELRSVIDSAAGSMVTCAQDWSTCKHFAWLYGVLVGWGDALDDVDVLHRGVETEDIERMVALNALLAKGGDDEG